MIMLLCFVLEINGSICVESDNESENIGRFGDRKPNESVFSAKLTDEPEFDSRFVESPFHLGTSVHLFLDNII